MFRTLGRLSGCVRDVLDRTVDALLRNRSGVLSDIADRIPGTATHVTDRLSGTTTHLADR